MKITNIEGVGPAFATKLEAQGIKTTAALLKSASNRKGREALASQTGISTKQILKWVNLADLMRVRGVGEEYSELLEAAGVDTIRELKRRRADNLHTTMVSVNDSKHMVRRCPSLSEVEGWIETAKKLEPVITY